MILLRDMRESDIEDYVRWFTVDTEWMKWDAPWEAEAPASEADTRKEWAAYYQSMQALPESAVRWKFEIEWNGRHVGWVSRYTDLEYMENKDSIPAIGIDIPEKAVRKQGIGTEALASFIQYLREKGFSSIYTQTWSGNMAMLRVAEKLNFKPFFQANNYRTVEGKAYDAVTFKLDL